MSIRLRLVLLLVFGIAIAIVITVMHQPEENPVITADQAMRLVTETFPHAVISNTDPRGGGLRQLRCWSE